MVLSVFQYQGCLMHSILNMGVIVMFLFILEIPPCIEIRHPFSKIELLFICHSILSNLLYIEIIVTSNGDAKEFAIYDATVPPVSIGLHLGFASNTPT